MSSMWGEHIRLSIFGESHGAGIGVVVDGLPAGETIDLSQIAFEMHRRAPGKDRTSTQRKETDLPEILSGFYQGHTTGAPLCAIIRNNDAHSGDYTQFSHIPRPGHADFTARIRYSGACDFRGGGHFSGRLTAPMVFAGAVCRQILSRRGIGIGAHLSRIGEVSDTPFDPVRIGREELAELAKKPFPTLSPKAENDMRSVIESARLDGDSVGGIVECAAAGLPAGLGDPIFGRVENRLSSAVFGIPAVKGIEFGAGFAAANLRGSQNNDAFVLENGNVRTKTNHSGGVLGGITTGMPLLFRVAFKPTPSIFKPQESVNLDTGENTTLEIKGRHDPCVAVRAVPVVEAMTAVCIADLFGEAYGNDIGRRTK